MPEEERVRVCPALRMGTSQGRFGAFYNLNLLPPRTGVDTKSSHFPLEWVRSRGPGFQPFLNSPSSPRVP